MSIIWRCWITVTVILALMLGTLGVLVSLQHDAVLASLTKKRISVIAQNTANSFQQALDIGLPLASIRNANDMLNRIRGQDSSPLQISVTDTSGDIVFMTDQHANLLPDDQWLMQLSASNEQTLHSETDKLLTSGLKLKAIDGSVAGIVIVAYAKEHFDDVSHSLVTKLISGALVMLVIFSSATWLVLFYTLRDARRGYREIIKLLRSYASTQSKLPRPAPPTIASYGFFTDAVYELHNNLAEAESCFRRLQYEQQTPEDGTSTRSTLIMPSPNNSLAYSMSRYLTPWVALILVSAIMSFGAYAHHHTQSSFEPEQAERLQLIGKLVNTDIQRAVDSGVPLRDLVGASIYFNELLEAFPEISYLGIRGDILNVSAGAQTEPGFWSFGNISFTGLPIRHDGQQIAELIIQPNPHYFTLQFRDILLDLGVFTIAALLVAFHVFAVTFSATLTGPFNRLMYLSQCQAKGDFTVRLNHFRHSEIDRAAAFLSERTARLGETSSSLIKPRAPNVLEFAYLNDVRLPLFLYAFTDALSVSFLPVYTANLSNSFHWIEGPLVQSLPLVGYLLAITLISPLVRPVIARMGHRRTLLWSSLLCSLFYAGLWNADTTVELTLYRSLTGAGFALSTLACQDYTLDVSQPAQRSRALALFTSTLFSGVFTGVAVGGILADRIGASNVFAIGAAMVLLAWALVFLMLPRQHHRASMHPFSLKIWRPLSNRQYRLLVLGAAIPSNALTQCFIAFLLALQLHSIGASAADIARVMMLYYLIIMIASALAPRLLPEISNWTKATLGLLISAFALGMASVSPTYWTLLLAVIVAGLGQALLRDPTIATALQLSDSQLKAFGSDTILSSLRAIERIGSALALLVIAFMVQHYGYNTGIAVLSVWLALAGTVCAIWQRQCVSQPLND